jgi:hypothetical protein
VVVGVVGRKGGWRKQQDGREEGGLLLCESICRLDCSAAVKKRFPSRPGVLPRPLPVTPIHHIALARFVVVCWHRVLRMCSSGIEYVQVCHVEMPFPL